MTTLPRRPLQRVPGRAPAAPGPSCGCSVRCCPRNLESSETALFLQKTPVLCFSLFPFVCLFILVCFSPNSFFSYAFLQDRPDIFLQMAPVSRSALQNSCIHEGPSGLLDIFIQLCWRGMHYEGCTEGLKAAVTMTIK